MSTANQQRAKSPRIGDHLVRRPHKQRVAAAVGRVRRRMRRVARRYQGGTRAEQVAHRKLRVEAKEEIRALVLGRRGRRIHLEALMRQSRPDGKPRWALADPTVLLGSNNGGYDEYGDARIRSRDVGPRHPKVRNVHPDSGFPALPPRVRRLVRDPKIRKRAEWVGVLWQPEEWRESNPDPAVVVKWRGVEGYFCLAVWGKDRPRLMEFID